MSDHCCLLIPVEGLMELFIYDIDPVAELRKREESGLVAIQLNKDDSLVATLHFPPGQPEQNPRATAVTGILCDSFIRVQGTAMFSGLTDGAAIMNIMREVDRR